ncbi:MAG: glycerol-3-phosphate 1-O-acyltransferase PlsY [Gammaproteobacteria bacterium]|nr:glycerol-3-phosphate 1-O-acyltransferase PlsY [Gammaproteobacteria bacterium]
MIELGLKFTVAYLLGSVLGSLVVGYVRGGVDIREVGSGNPGGTNALRTQGRLFALWVMVIDVGKGMVAVLVLPNLELFGFGVDPTVSRELVLYAVAFAAILGHVYPLWFDFKGGKGGATAIGIICALEPQLAIGIIALWLAVIAFTGFVGLATMLGAVAAAAWVGAMRFPEDVGLLGFTTAVALLIVFTHRSNIRRMRDGTEVRMGMLRRGG